VVVATVGSVARNPGNLGRLDLIMIDECHLVSRKESGQYRKLIADCQRFNPALRVIGWTGTPYRGNGIWLTSGEERLFTDIAARVGMSELLADGYLSPLVPVKTDTQVDAEGIRTANGDYVVSALAERLDQDELTKKIASEMVRAGVDRQRWLAFCVTIKHAEHMCDELKSLGIAAALVTGETPKAEREKSIRLFRSGHYRCLVNVAVLTTGFDVPEVDLIALVRNTQSPVLYTQIAGRGMRIAEGKTECLWLDFTDTTERLGPVDQLKGRNEVAKKDKVAAPFKICDNCGTENPAGVAVCKDCGFEFPAPEIKIRAESNGADIISVNNFGYQTYVVNKVAYRKQISKAGVPMLRVDYLSGMRSRVTEYVCLEHDGYARAKAERWWESRWHNRVKLPTPNTVDQALAMTNFLREPAEVVAKKSGNYNALVSVVMG
jgi:DNA repair protein RadD